jgi:hypothetical protein
MSEHRGIVNPASQERFVFLSPPDAAPEDPFVMYRYQLPGGVVPEHIHPAQEEIFEVLEGEMTFIIQGRTSTHHPGETVIVPPGVRHALKNLGTSESKARVTLDPGFDARSFFEIFSALAREGKTVRHGVPRNLLTRAVIARRYRREIALAFPPVALQQLFAAPAAALGRRLGHTPYYWGGASANP